MCVLSAETRTMQGKDRSIQVLFPRYLPMASVAEKIAHWIVR